MHLSRNISKRKKLILGGSLLLIMFSLIGTTVFGPPIITDADAAETQISLGISTTLSLATAPEGSLAISISPTASGPYSTRKLTASVATNNLTGFTLTMSSGEGIEDPNSDEIPSSFVAGTNLVNLSGSSTNLLPSTTGTVDTPSAINLNTWGFSVPKVQVDSDGLLPNNPVSTFDNAYNEVTSEPILTEKYAGLPPISSPLTLKTTALLTGNNNTDLFFGARVSTSKPSGNYRGTVILSVVPNYVEPYIPYMQDMTASECSSMSHGDTVEMKDRRDENIYTVAKIGERCWMAENLALGDTSAAMTLTPEDSDVASDWVLPPPVELGVSSDNTFALWIPANIGNSDYCTPNGAEGCGNFYDFYAATAGTGAPLTSGDAPSSICPANWKLPSGGINSDFADLNSALGGDDFDPDSIDPDDPDPIPPYLVEPPYSMARAGYYSGSVSFQGIDSFYWTTLTDTLTFMGTEYVVAYTMNVLGVMVFPGTRDVNKENGLSVRCILR